MKGEEPKRKKTRNVLKTNPLKNIKEQQQNIQQNKQYGPFI